MQSLVHRSLAPLANVRIVLVETTHPGNIGASARAMKAMGLSRLYLVNPSRFPCAEATALAAGADDVLEQGVVCHSLAEALQGCGLVVGTSARQRTLAWPALDPRSCGAQIIETAVHDQVALVFGREHSGLTNEELEFCHFMVRIPTVSGFSSLNLAAAVQILAYEIFIASIRGDEIKQKGSHEAPAATIEQLQQLYAHLEQVMIEVGFFDPNSPRRLMRRLKRLFNRAQLDQNEVNILRGFLAAVRERTKVIVQYPHPDPPAPTARGS